MKLIKKQGLQHFLLIACAALLVSMPASASHVVQGPSGGTGGGSFTDWGTSSERIMTVFVRSGSWIDSVHTIFQNSGGVSRATPHRGGYGGSMGTIVNLAAGEDITEVSGYFSGYVRYLRIRTSLGNTYTYGNAVGKYFSYQRPSGFKFAGFRGASGSYVDSIGAIWRPQ